MNSMLEYRGYRVTVEYDAEDKSIDNYQVLFENIGKGPDKFD